MPPTPRTTPRRRYRDKVPAWYDPSDPAAVARYRDLVATREAARAAGVPIGWWQPYQRCLAFVATNGRLPVRREPDGKWAQDQRAAKRRGALSERQVTLLEQITGWEWERQVGTLPDQDGWQARYDALAQFRHTHGRRPTAAEDRTLYDWWRRQTGAARGYLTEERARLIAALAD